MSVRFWEISVMLTFLSMLLSCSMATDAGLSETLEQKLKLVTLQVARRSMSSWVGVMT